MIVVTANLVHVNKHVPVIIHRALCLYAVNIYEKTVANVPSAIDNIIGPIPCE